MSIKHSPRSAWPDKIDNYYFSG
ncbi:MAG: hypothetical protein QOG48_2462, partial [Verrucomicrobiota bacterium]